MKGTAVAKEVLWPPSPESQLRVAFLETAPSFPASLGLSFFTCEMKTIMLALYDSVQVKMNKCILSSQQTALCTRNVY